jgi:pyridoxine/pyridoxamine 5'-phosphate oxidase
MAFPSRPSAGSFDWVAIGRDSFPAPFAKTRSDVPRSLEARAVDLALRYPGNIPRRPHWTGFAVHAQTIEFWRSRPDRLHDRMLYTRSPNRWQRTWLYP